MKGIKFNDLHSYNDFSLILNSKKIETPVAKTCEIEVEGANGSIDLTEVLGDVKFKSRKLTFEFSTIVPMSEFLKLFSEIQKSLHGKNMTIIMDDDPEFYYWGRVNVNEWKTDKRVGKITIDCKVKPYKYAVTSSLEDWLWDPFDFNADVIRDWKLITINGPTNIRLVGGAMPVIPIFICDSPMTLLFEGITFNLVAGINKITDVYVRNGEYTATFTGNGKVTIDYREGRL